MCIRDRTRSARPVDLEFEKGASIGENSEATVSDETAALFLYSYDPETGTPVFTPVSYTHLVIKQIDASDFATLDATQKSYLGFAYAYRPPSSK